MAFRNSATGEYPVSRNEIISLYPNTSFPRQFEQADGFDWVAATEPPAIDQVSQYVEEGTPVNENGVWKQTWVVRSFTAEAIAERQKTAVDNQAAEVRYERNAKLAQSDWTQLSDSPSASQFAWAEYRQKLRDVPAQAGFPWTVTWPVKPGEE